MILRLLLGAWGKVIHEKNLKQKSRDTVPLNQLGNRVVVSSVVDLDPNPVGSETLAGSGSVSGSRKNHFRSEQLCIRNEFEVKLLYSEKLKFFLTISQLKCSIKKIFNSFSSKKFPKNLISYATSGTKDIAMRQCKQGM
jgi:hypothetical protein